MMAGISWTTPKIFLHFKQLTIRVHFAHLLFRRGGLASPFQRPVVKDRHFARLDVNLGDSASREPKSFHVEHLLAGIRFAQSRLGYLIRKFRACGKADQKLLGQSSQ